MKFTHLSKFVPGSIFLSDQTGQDILQQPSGAITWLNIPTKVVKRFSLMDQNFRLFYEKNYGNVESNSFPNPPCSFWEIILLSKSNLDTFPERLKSFSLMDHNFNRLFSVYVIVLWKCKNEVIKTPSPILKSQNGRNGKLWCFQIHQYKSDILNGAF